MSNIEEYKERKKTRLKKVIKCASSWITPSFLC